MGIGSAPYGQTGPRTETVKIAGVAVGEGSHRARGRLLTLNIPSGQNAAHNAPPTTEFGDCVKFYVIVMKR